MKRGLLKAVFSIVELDVGPKEAKMKLAYLALIVGGTGLDEWDKEVAITASDFLDAAKQAHDQAVEWNGQVAFLERRD